MLRPLLRRLDEALQSASSMLRRMDEAVDAPRRSLNLDAAEMKLRLVPRLSDEAQMGLVERLVGWTKQIKIFVGAFVVWTENRRVGGRGKESASSKRRSHGRRVLNPFVGATRHTVPPRLSLVQEQIFRNHSGTRFRSSE